MPDNWEWNHVVGLGINSKNEIFAYNRSEHPMIVLNPAGEILRTRGEGVFATAPHLFIDPDDSVYTTDLGTHVVQKWSPEGNLLLTMGTPNQPAEPMSGDPFNGPTAVYLGLDGSMYRMDTVTLAFTTTRPTVTISDPGASQALNPVNSKYRTVFASTVRALCTFQAKSIAVYRFSQKAAVTIREWEGIHRPDHMSLDANENMYIAELSNRQGLFPGRSLPGSNGSPRRR